MKSITKFVADDGAEFRAQSDCEKHEALCREIDGIMSALPKHPNTCEFTNGGGYIQHNRDAFMSARRALLLVANRINPHKWFDQSLADQSIHESWAGRIISEMARPISTAWHRISCTDNKFREWGQPYYAANPDKATQACIATAQQSPTTRIAT